MGDINGSCLTYGCGTWRPLPMLTLPSTFDESLSYYEQICQLLAMINKVAEQINMIGDDAFAEFKKYTDEEIKKVKDDMRIELNRMNDMLIEFSNSIHALEVEYFEFNEQIKRMLIEMEGRLELFILNNIADGLPFLTNPWNGVSMPIQQIFNYIPSVIHNSLTAIEYDQMCLTAAEYDAKKITAENYIKYGRWIFLRELYMRMWNPFTGERASPEQVIHMLADLHKDALTAAEYDGLNLTAKEYADRNLSAYEYDWMGKKILT